MAELKNYNDWLRPNYQWGGNPIEKLEFVEQGDIPQHEDIDFSISQEAFSILADELIKRENVLIISLVKKIQPDFKWDETSKENLAMVYGAGMKLGTRCLCLKNVVSGYMEMILVLRPYNPFNRYGHLTLDYGTTYELVGEAIQYKEEIELIMNERNNK